MRRNIPVLTVAEETTPLKRAKNFIALDGESIEDKYVLLGTSHPSYCLENKQGITTDEALDFLYRLGHNRHIRKARTAFVGYFFSYDVEMICKDLPEKIKKRLFNPRNILISSGEKKGTLIKDRVIYETKTGNRYELTYIKRKYFSVRKIDWTVNSWSSELPFTGLVKTKSGITIYDVSGFFTGFPSRSFISVLTQLGIEVPREIKQGKEGRSSFTWKDYQTIKEYNRLECILLVELMQKIYSMCESQNLVPRRWYGSSAVGNLFLRKHKINEFMRRTVQENMSGYFWDAITRAYFGGRIEAFKLGTFQNVFSYDICSAYPHAITKLPSTRDNHFIYTQKFRKGFAIWHVRFKFPKAINIGVFPFRLTDGSIKFPLAGEGWYWNPEVEVALKHWPDCVDVIDGYYISDPKKPTPLQTLFPALYEARKKLKQAGDFQHYIIKIVLNACYGKFAQKVGRADFKNFSWAGWITSETRARLREAVIGHEESIIAFSTDGIYSLVPLKLKLSDKLGGWEKDEYERGTILMSGVYLLEGKGKPKTGERGYKQLSDWTGILEQLNENIKKKDRAAVVIVKLFVGFNMADNFPEEYGKHYLKFVEKEKLLNPYGLTKRKYLTKQIKDWMADYCDSEPIGRLSGLSCSIKTQPEYLDDDDLIFTESGDEILWVIRET